MARVLCTLLFIMVPLITVGQERTSKADELFYGYRYAEAIAAYKKEGLKEPLTPQQRLNLADAYFRTDRFRDASELYVQLSEKDTVMTPHHVNKMLQSFSKSSQPERIGVFLGTRSQELSKALLENANFNKELLASPQRPNQLKVMPLTLNTPYMDFSPAFYEGSLLFSSSRPRDSKLVYGPSGEAYLNIYEAAIGENGDIGAVTTFAKIPDSRYHKATPFYSPALDKFFYTLSNTENGEMAFDENGKNALGIGMAKGPGTQGFVLKDLSTSFYYPFYDDATERLYFAANFGDGQGGTDIYYVETNKGQIMSSPTNLGPRINTPGNEISPYLYNGSLYFSSDVFYGMGGMDIYKSNLKKDGGFSIPVNLGVGLNTSADDFGFIIRSNGNGGHSGYFASNRPGGKGADDIYAYTLATVPGLKTFAFSGNVANQITNQGLEAVTVNLLAPDGTVLVRTLTDANGRFEMEVPWQDGVSLQIEKEGHSSYSKAFSPQEMDILQEKGLQVPLVRLEDLLTNAEGKTVLDLEKFYFDKGKSQINAAISAQLDKVVAALKQFPELRLAIETHTDSRGSSNYNLRLSQERSDAIKAYLEANGAERSQIAASIGYGETQITNNCVDGAYCLDFLHKQNERTLIVVQNN
ncbi:OmpA family protein [Maribacter sp. 2307ULW6-5]|uniref:OmpA family protein n=1 Tax=Maribacter sp. 2307ULW6-5 TaxID=3386275 RepID=UPI0039BCF4AA